MELLNATPLAAAYNQGLDAEGRESLVVIARAVSTCRWTVARRACWTSSRRC